MRAPGTGGLALTPENGARREEVSAQTYDEIHFVD
jgi:hypothetical protein